VVSGDDGGFISVWDIENGKLMSKFGDAHGVNINMPLKIILSYRKLRLQQEALTILEEDL
jgi:hypothetical protein